MRMWVQGGTGVCRARQHWGLVRPGQQVGWHCGVVRSLWFMKERGRWRVTDSFTITIRGFYLHVGGGYGGYVCGGYRICNSIVRGVSSHVFNDVHVWQGRVPFLAFSLLYRVWLHWRGECQVHSSRV